MITLSLTNYRHRLHVNKWLILFAGAYLLTGIYLLRDYLDVQALNFQLGCAALCVCTQVNATRKGRARYGITALCLAALTCWIPVKTFAFLAMAAGVLFAIESFAGSINILLLLIAACMSPLAAYASQVFSFPIRLQLSNVAGWLLQKTGMPVTVAGNMMQFQGTEFSVDPACMGLHMLIASLLAGMMLVSVISKKYQRHLSFGFVILLLFIILGLNMVANVLRITTLVYFQVMPGTFLHDAMGLFCFALYVILPSLFLVRYAVRRWGRLPALHIVRNETPFYRRNIIRNSLVTTIVICVAVFRLTASSSHGMQTTHATLNGFRVESLAEQITKLHNDSVLVYIKPIRSFYGSDHNPTICWTGSGYRFTQVTQQPMQGGDIYKAILEKDKAQLYTAWWYDNGTRATISQYSWRWDALQTGHPYAIVNITSSSQKELLKAIRQFRQQPSYRQFIREVIPAQIE